MTKNPLTTRLPLMLAVLLLLAIGLFAVQFAAATPAFAAPGVGGSATPDFPNQPLEIGDVIDVALTITNESTPDVSNFGTTLISLHPSCGNSEPGECDDPEPGIFDVVGDAGVGTGDHAGTPACPANFGIAVDGQGFLTFTPNLVDLPLDAKCRIEFQVTVTGAPADGSGEAHAVGYMEAVGDETGGQGSGSGSGTDTVHFEPAIDIEKATNGQDADNPTGPVLSVGDAVSWTYEVTNNGAADLFNVVVDDDQGVVVTCPSDSLAVGESMTCTADGVAESGQYANIGTVTAEDENGTVVSDEDPSHYFAGGGSTFLEISASDPAPSPGSIVTLTITDTNDGDFDLTDPFVEVTSVPEVPEIVAGLILDAPPDSGDDNNDGIMNVGEVWTWMLEVTVDTDTVFTATGHGTDPFGVDITFPDDPDEQDEIMIAPFSIAVGGTTSYFGSTSGASDNVFGVATKGYAALLLAAGALAYLSKKALLGRNSHS